MTRLPVVKKTTVNLPPDTLAAAKAMAERQHTTVSDVIRRALELQSCLHDATVAGEKLLLEHPDKSLRQLVILR